MKTFVIRAGGLEFGRLAASDLANIEFAQKVDGKTGQWIPDTQLVTIKDYNGHTIFVGRAAASVTITEG